MVALVPASTPVGGVSVGSVVVAVVEATADVVTGANVVSAESAGAVGVATGAGATGVVLTLLPLHAATKRDKAAAIAAIDPLRTFTR
jgi:hypothetical protein